MQFITVTFAEERDVIIDGEIAGKTDQVLQVEKGTHRIRLDDKQNYTPQWRQPNVRGPTIITRMEILFDEIED